ncbi:hypothetical protein GYB29_14705 [bacterium]|nr:hypothetical protein [bacterium]
MNSTFISIASILLLTFCFTELSFAQENLLLKVETDRIFSSPDSEDLFQIILVGDSVHTGEVTFNIISSKGDTLLNNVYKASAFNMKYAYTNDATTAQISEEISNNLNSFFAPSNFSSPAIGKDESEEYVDEDYTNLDIWKDIKSDQTAVGFTYSLYGEYTNRITYSKSLGKIVSIWSCC